MGAYRQICQRYQNGETDPAVDEKNRFEVREKKARKRIMEEKREEKKLGLSGEDVKKGAPNPAGLFQAMGNEECDAEAIAASEDGRMNN